MLGQLQMLKDLNAPNGGPAFPQHGWSKDPETLKRMATQGGMTLRDYFAAHALGAFCAHVERSASTKNVAEWSYEIADAMLKAREK